MTETKIIFLILISALAVWDYFILQIPNFIVLPAIACGGLLTGQWQWAVIMFLVGAGLFAFSHECPNCGHVEVHKHRFSLHRGGDVKLFAMLGAFLGWYALPTCLVGYAVVYLYRWHSRVYAPLPVTPFMFLSSLIFIWAAL